MERLQNGVAVVTGASEGIGAEICRQLVNNGMVVLACARRKEKIESIATLLTEAKSPGKLIPFKCDMSKEIEILAMYEEFQSLGFCVIDVCINNAISLYNQPLVGGDVKTDEWRKMIEVNVLGICINNREVLKRMKDSCGQIINIGCSTGHNIPNLESEPDIHTAGTNFYHGTKFMIRALTEGLRQELKKRKIRVSTISPGIVMTKLLEKVSSPLDAYRFFNKSESLSPEIVTSAVIFILSTPEHVNIHDIIMEARETKPKRNMLELSAVATTTRAAEKLESMKKLFGPHLVNFNRDFLLTTTALSQKKIIGIYFRYSSTESFFSKLLSDFIEDVNQSGRRMQVILVTNDRNEDRLYQYLLACPHLLSVPLHSNHIKELETKFNVKGKEALVIIRNDGSLVSANGKLDIRRHGINAFLNWDY